MSDEQDCGCLTHTGPHWKHMDRLDRERNQAMLERAQNTKGWDALLGFMGFIQEEQHRLQEKAYQMRIHGDE